MMRTPLQLAWLLLLLAPSSALAQDTGIVEGTVIDAQTGEGLPGASVRVLGTNTGTATPVSGQYQLALDAGTYTLVATFVGYDEVQEQVTVRAGETTTQNFELAPDLTGLDEVVVTGIASRRSKARSEVSVGTVNVEELTAANTYQDVSQVFTGKMAGVNLQTASGNIGGGIRFNIRGQSSINSSQPVVYVDGVRLDNSQFAGYGVGGQDFGPLSDLNPEDIASIEVLKGPAAASIYGTEGANGVVLITTKRGQLGRDVRVNYKGTFGTSEQQQAYGDFYISADAANDIFQEGGVAQHSIDVSGGGETVSYFASVTHRNEDGILNGIAGQRTNFRTNFEAYPGSDLTIRASAGYTLSEIFRPINDNSIIGQLGNVLLAPGGDPFYFTSEEAIYAFSDRSRAQRFVGSLQGSWRPLAGLSVNFQGGYDGTSRRQDQLFPATYSYVGVTRGERSTYNRAVNAFNTNTNVAYAYAPMEGLQLTSTAGAQFTNERVQTFFGSAQDFDTDLITEIGAANDYQSIGEGFANNRTGGVYFQQDLSYEDTYFFTASVRRDFATEFGEQINVSSIVYPSIKGAARIDRLGFAPSLLTLLKLRAAYGVSGVLPGVFDALPLTFGGFPSPYGTAALISTVGDETISPERVSEIEAGVDLEVFNRYSLELTYFQTWSEDAIVPTDRAPSTGFGFITVPQNVGSIESNGLEVAVGLTPYQSRSNQVDINFTYTYVDNEVTDLGGAADIFGGFDANVIGEGLPKSAFYVPEVIGAQFDETTGEILLTGGGAARVELSEDGERQLLGTPYAKHYGGLNLGLRLFRNFNVSALVEYAAGLSVFNGTQQFAILFGNSQRYRELQEQLGIADFDDIELEVLEPGTDAYIEVGNDYAQLNANYDGNFVQDADYIKLREVSVRYDFGDLIGQTGYTGLRNLVLGVSARNVQTWTRYEGPDPEVNFGGGSDDDLGYDFLTLQTPRQLYFTVQVGF